jgi:hypothetical protein
MKDELFTELVASVREGGGILCGEAEPSSTFVVGGGEATGLGSLALSLLKLRKHPLPPFSGPFQPLPMQEREDLPVNTLLSEPGLEHRREPGIV